MKEGRKRKRRRGGRGLLAEEGYSRRENRLIKKTDPRSRMRCIKERRKGAMTAKSAKDAFPRGVYRSSLTVKVDDERRRNLNVPEGKGKERNPFLSGDSSSEETGKDGRRK